MIEPRFIVCGRRDRNRTLDPGIFAKEQKVDCQVTNSLYTAFDVIALLTTNFPPTHATGQ
jgi:hypothetical protein